MAKAKKKKPKRKLSKYNLHMKREMKKGKTFLQATRSWKKGSGSKSNPKPKTRARAAVTRAAKGGRKVAKGFNQQKIFKLARIAALLGPHAGVWLSSAAPMEKANESVKMLSGFDMNTGQFDGGALARGYLPVLATTAVTALIPKINSFLKGIL